MDVKFDEVQQIILVVVVKCRKRTIYSYFRLYFIQYFNFYPNHSTKFSQILANKSSNSHNNHSLRLEKQNTYYQSTYLFLKHIFVTYGNKDLFNSH